MECSEHYGSAGNSACAPLECRFCRSDLSSERKRADNEEHSRWHQNR